MKENGVAENVLMDIIEDEESLSQKFLGILDCFFLLLKVWSGFFIANSSILLSFFNHTEIEQSFISQAQDYYHLVLHRSFPVQ